MKTYYKLTTLDNKSILNILNLELYSQYSIKYILNEWIMPKLEGSKLFVFSTKKAVKNFISFKDKSYFRCYVCNVRQPQKIKRIVVTDKDIEPFWQLFNSMSKASLKKISDESVDIVKISDNVEILVKMAPVGSIACSAIKLLREVEL